MSINRLIEISRRSFQTLDGAMNTVGQNVANANTEGYVRRRVTLQADATSPLGPRMQTGLNPVTSNGVSLSSFERVRDSLLSAAGWDAQAGLGASEEEARILGALEGLFPPSGEGSLGGQLNEFWNAWSDLADNPNALAARNTIRSRAENLASTLNGLATGLDALQQQAGQALQTGVEDINKKLGEIADLNAHIEGARLKGTPDLAAEDRRDTLVKELSAFVPLKVQEDAHLGYGITVDGMSVLQGDKVTPLEIEQDNTTLDPMGNPTLRVVFGDSGVAFRTQAGNDGKLGAWLRTRNTDIPGARAELDQLAGALVTELNALHTNRFDADAPPATPIAGANFFDPAGTTAGTIRVSDAVRADASVIAPQNQMSEDPEAPGTYLDTALLIASARTRGFAALGGETADRFAINLVSDVGTKVQKAATRAASQETSLLHIESLEQGLSGVSVDEEMTSLIRFQQGFAASARVLDTAQRMMDTLLAL